MCPLSSVALRIVDTPYAHVLPAMLDEGLRVRLNSDDPAYFGGYVDANLEAVRREVGLTGAQMAMLARNSFDACSPPMRRKSAGKAKVDDFAARNAPVAG